ncbi:MAG: sugar transferase [candidate division Zixibacteria bacterium]
MRYLSPVTNPLAHYWEEDITGIWGVWLRFRVKSGRALGRVFGEFILANLYLAIETVVNIPLIIALSSRIENVSLKNRFDAFAKRMIDIIGAMVGLLISVPFWVIIPLLIKLDSKGPVLYSQVRVGLNRRRRDRRRLSFGQQERREGDERRGDCSYGQPFRIYKFRTMGEDAEKLSGPVWAKQHDPRITKLGLLLRKTRIDEIPQLINVLLGHMSLVGPRPERPFFVEKLDGIIEDYRGRFQVKPGVTGLAQVEHKYDESIKDVSDKIVHDLKYINSWSIFQDIRIMLKTVIVVLTARGM